MQFVGVLVGPKLTQPVAIGIAGRFDHEVDLFAHRLHRDGAIVKLAAHRDLADRLEGRLLRLRRRYELDRVRMDRGRLKDIGGRRARVARLVERRPFKLERAAVRATVDPAPEGSAV